MSDDASVDSDELDRLTEWVSDTFTYAGNAARDIALGLMCAWRAPYLTYK